MSSFPNPEGKINVLKRYLHILALLQYIPKNEETWNASKLADLLSEDEAEKPLDDSQVRKYIKDHIKDELEIEVNTKKGKLVSSLAKELDIDTQLKIARVYSGFVVKDTSRDVILEKFIKAMPDRALWTLGRIYFASIEKRMILISYTTNPGYKMYRWKLCPYYFIFRNNNLYLVVYDPRQMKTIPLLAERITNIKVMKKSESISWEIPPVEEVFKDSLSAFITDSKPVKMKIRYNKTVANLIESITSPLGPETKPVKNSDLIESTFQINDYLYLCKQFVFYGGNVEIISPRHVRDEMINMLKESLAVYE